MTTPPPAVLARLEALEDKWRRDADTDASLGAHQMAEGARNCADELAILRATLAQSQGEPRAWLYEYAHDGEHDHCLSVRRFLPSWVEAKGATETPLFDCLAQQGEAVGEFVGYGRVTGEPHVRMKEGLAPGTKLFAHPAAVDEWTSVGTAFPPKHEWVLLYHDGSVSIGKYWPHEKGVHDDPDWCWEVMGSDWVDSVTHWRPIPSTAALQPAATSEESP